MTPPKDKIKQILVFGALVVTGLYVVCLIGLTVAQRRLIYYPCTTPIKEQQSAGIQGSFEVWRDSRAEIIGWFRPSESKKPRRTMLLLHGNAGCASDWFHYAAGFGSVEPVDFYILEYPGYGGRRGAASEASILHAADEAMASISKTCTVYVVGESLGTGPACYLASKYKSRIAGLFLVAPYNNLAAAAQKHLPFFPVKWMLRDKYPSDKWLEEYRGPVAVLLAERDEVIPSELGRRLFEGYRGPKKLWVEPSASHDNVHRPRADLYREVIGFWSEH